VTALSSVAAPTDRPSGAWRQAGWAVALLAAVLVTIGEVLRQRALADPDLPAAYRETERVLLAVAFLAFGAVGAAILSRRTGNRVAWLLCLASLLGALRHAADGYAAFGQFSSQPPLPLAHVAVWASEWLFILQLIVPTTLLPLLFPDGRLPSSRWRPFLQLTGAVAVFFCIAWAFAKGPMQAIPLENPLGAPSPLGDLLAAVRFAGWYALVLLAAVAAASLVVRYQRSEPDERAQIRWVAFATVILAVALIVSAGLFVSTVGRTDETTRLVRLVSNLIVVVGFAAVPVAAGIAVLRHRLYDIDILIDRSFVYGSLVAILAGLYAASVQFFKALFVGLTGDESDAAIVITTLILATTFTPIKNRLEEIARRRFKEPQQVPTSADASLVGVDALRAELREQAGRLERLEHEVGGRS
jgi:hypothetical protein